METFPVRGEPVRVEAHEPAGASRGPAILLLHGAGGNVGSWLDRIAPVLGGAGVSVYAPHYFESTGTRFADMATISDGVHVPVWLDALAAALAFVAARSAVDPERIALVGVSLGAFLSLSYAAGQCALPVPLTPLRCLVDLSGGLPEPYASLATASFPPTLIVHGEADNVVPVSFARELDARLTRLGVPHDLRLLPREGHWFGGGAQMQILMAVAGFLQQHLKPAKG